MALALLVAARCEAAGWQLASLQYEASKIPLELVAPRAGLSTENRYYKAYPGLLYRVPVVVLGGAYPYQYTLTSAPSGMTLGQHYGDTDYGVINWANPTAGTSSVTVQITDQMGAVATVSYSISVTTSGFIFVDSVKGHHSVANGGTGTGTLANPFLTMDDFYSGTVGGAASYSSRKADQSYAGYFVYYRAGTYATSTMATEGAEVGSRVPFVSGNKPKVHLAYPGEIVTINTSGGAIIFYSDSAGNYYMGGLSWAGMGGSGDNKAWEFDSGFNDIGSFECHYDGSSASAGTNAAMVMSRSGGAVSNYVFMSHDTFGTINGFNLFLAYKTNKVVIENNTISGVANGNGFFAKELNNNWSVRNNVGLANNPTQLFTMQNWLGDQANFDISWNNYKSNGDGLFIGLGSGSGILSNVWSRRNTWQIAQHTLNAINIGSLYATNDVTNYTNGSANAHGWVLSSGTMAGGFSGEECVTRGASCTDSSGNLTGAAKTSYLGVRGHEIGLGGNPPVPPPVFTVLPVPLP